MDVDVSENLIQVEKHIQKVFVVYVQGYIIWMPLLDQMHVKKTVQTKFFMVPDPGVNTSEKIYIKI
jgi:hypothetical protein